MKFPRTRSLLLALFAATYAMAQDELNPYCTFIQIVMDESGSMETEQEFLSGAAMPAIVEDLRIRLKQRVFVCSWGFGYEGRNQAIPLSGRDLGCSIGFNIDNYAYRTNGGTEDGYAAMKAASDVAKGLNTIDGKAISDCRSISYYMILATDEDRDNWDQSKNFAGTLQFLKDEGWILHAILNNPINNGLGIGAVEEATADPASGKLDSYKVYSSEIDQNSPSKYKETRVSFNPVGLGPGKPDYSPMAFATDGAVWDLNKLREGGFTAESFGEAFINTTTTIIEETSTLPPSAAPSATPSVAPSAAPTGVPSAAPTKETASPTTSPTESRSPAYTSPPTGSPSAIPSATPSSSPSTSSPTANPSAAPTKAPNTAAPTTEPDVCDPSRTLPCIKDGGETAFRVVLQAFLLDLFTDQEIDFVIPPLADELMTAAVQAEMQNQICIYSQELANYDIARGGLAIFRSLLGSGVQGGVDLAQTTLETIRESIDISIPRGVTLLASLGTLFGGGVDTSAFSVNGVGELFIDSLQEIALLCLDENLPDPPIPTLPTLPPISLPEDPKGLICFSGDNTVHVQGKGATLMAELEIGDYVEVGKGQYDLVYSFGHYDASSVGSFLRIHVHGLKQPLEISGPHLLFSKVDGAVKAVTASSIQIGDMLVLEGDNVAVVRSIAEVDRRGVYAPFTYSGRLVVSGVLASNYASIQHSEFLKIASYETPMSMHWISHVSQAPHRLYCKLRSCDAEVYTPSGLSSWAEGPYRFFTWTLSQHIAVTTFVLVPAILGMLLAAAVEVSLTYQAVWFAFSAIALWLHLKNGDKPSRGTKKFA